MRPKIILLVLAALGGLFTLANTARAQGTAFTYQGLLNSGTNPANGSFDVQFSLYAIVSGGSAIVGPVVKTNVGVANGLFTATVDFGFVFAQSNYWLELAVRTNGASSFSPALAPRQPLTPTPYAIYAETANASGLSGTLFGNGGGLTNLNATNLAGTVAAASLPANVALLNANQTFTGNNTLSTSGISGNNTLQFGAGLLGQHPNAGKIGYEALTPDSLDIVGAGTSAGSHKIQFWAEGGANFNGQVTINGKVGAGVLNPAAPLSVTGSLTMVNDFGTLPPGVHMGGIAGYAGQTGVVIAGSPTSGNAAVLAFADGVPGVWGAMIYSAANSSFSFNENGVFSGELTCTAVNITSDRNAKEDFKPVNPREVLDKVAHLPITEWQYKTQSAARHIGPMAQDFRAAFAVGHDDKHIASVDEDGVALAAIQGLNEKLDEKDVRIQQLENTVNDLKALVTKLAARQNGGAK